MKTNECIGYGDGISEEDHPVVGGGSYNEGVRDEKKGV